VRRLLMLAALVVWASYIAQCQGGKILVLKEPEHPDPPLAYNSENPWF